MMSMMKGLSVQKSRFAVLSLEPDSDEEEGRAQGKWQQVAPGKPKPASQKKGGSSTGGGQGEEGKALSKSAKKRARKRRNKSTSSDRDGSEPCEAASESKAAEKGGESDGYQEMWKKKNESAMEEEFQRNMREALIRSSIEAKAQEKLLIELKEAEERAKGPTSIADVKKQVKLSLHDLHRTPLIDPSTLAEPFPVAAPIPASRTPTSSIEVFSPSLEMFGLNVEEEIKKEMKKKPTDKRLSEEEIMMVPRVAQLEDEVEKKDKIIAKLKKNNLTLKQQLAEVKERNQSLCSIMSHGELSEKADLVKQVKELSALKTDLTLEVESLSSLLEQERTKNKSLKAELTKVQNSLAKLSKN